jgi:hypothetical protein
MPFPSNWLEELVTEWLEIEGFFVETTPPVNVGGGGGRFAPDVVGARIVGSALEIRHCEVAAWLAQAPTDVVASYSRKFSQPIEDGVKQEFRRVLGFQPTQQIDYTQWIVSGSISQNVRLGLATALPAARILQLDEFFNGFVLPAIGNWKQVRNSARGNLPTLPSDKWLLQLIESLQGCGLLQP